MRYYVLIFTLICIGCTNLTNNHSTFSSSFQPQVGDLLFQDLNCGSLCDGINKVTYGINNTYISHVGMIVGVINKQPMVIEAIGNKVSIHPLSVFLQRSLDYNKKPMVLVMRLKPQYKYLIPKAVRFAQTALNTPFNDSFYPNNGTSYYCSQLIDRAFRVANHNHQFFKLNIMTFNDSKTHHILPQWKSYFNSIHTIAPEHQLGTNPGMMSRDHRLYLVFQYGVLRTNN